VGKPVASLSLFSSCYGAVDDPIVLRLLKAILSTIIYLVLYGYTILRDKTTGANDEED